MNQKQIFILSIYAVCAFLNCKKNDSPSGNPVQATPADTSKAKIAAITNKRTSQTYPTLSAAAAAAQSGDLIQVPSGTYTNDVVNIDKNLSINGIGGMARFVATVPPPNGKAIFVINGDVTLDHIEMSGSAVADNNGAGIKQETGNLTLTNCYFHDNQDGVLTNQATSSISITNCEFAHNGKGDGYSHNLYIGKTPTASIKNSYFHDAVVGHEIKCRALNTLVEGCRILNGNGTASYCIDLPQGGVAVVRNNLIEKGSSAQNPIIIHFGGEDVNPNSSLTVTTNTVVSRKSNYTYVANQMTDNSNATVSGNSVFGLTDSQMLSVSFPNQGSVSGTIHLQSAPALDRSSVFHP